ncbi:MAG: alcohol dehydrogenase catalytic domain-containing protein [Ruminococcus sp.]|jgi:threonine dehydrogenase-like Zn-dependent dehydrogenase
MKKIMQAAVFCGNGIVQIEEKQVPIITKPDEVLIKVHACGICGSDLHVLNVPPGQYAKPGTVLGHEFVGTVEATGAEVETLKIGDKVVAEPNIRCGICPECRRGNFNLCRNAVNTGQTRDGGLAQYCLMPEKQLYPVPKDMPDHLAALAEPLACVMNGMQKINPQPAQKVLLYGAGAIGLFFVKALKRYGVKDIMVAELMESRRKDAKRAGADIVVDPAADDIASVMQEKWGGFADVAIDAVGAGSVLEQSIDLVNCGSTILIFGQNMSQKSTIRPGMINNKELTITAALSTKNSFLPAIDLLKDYSLKFEELITHVVKLKEVNKGIEWMRNGEAIKVMVEP